MNSPHLKYTLTEVSLTVLPDDLSRFRENFNGLRPEFAGFTE
jgi:hypothetical protein